MRKLSSLVVRTLAVAGLAAITSAVLPAATIAQPAPEHITVGASTDDLARPLLYAVDAGLFKKVGLDVEIVKLANGAAVAAAVAGGALDLGKGSALTPVQAYAKGIPFTVTANLGDYTADAPSIAMLVLKNSPLRGPKDLAGKTIGMVGLQDSITLGIYTWLEQNGVDIAAEKFIEIGNSAGVAALEAGRVDAMMFQEPALSAAITVPDLRVFAYPDNALGRRFSLQPRTPRRRGLRRRARKRDQTAGGEVRRRRRRVAAERPSAAAHAVRRTERYPDADRCRGEIQVHLEGVRRQRHDLRLRAEEEVAISFCFWALLLP
jgi:ABC-type amino acid transport substrate-binding protein